MDKKHDRLRKTFFFAFGVFWLWLAMAPVSAPRAEASNSSSDDEYSFNWLDPEKKIYVLQNRRFKKSGHLLLSATAGFGLSNPYRDVITLDPRLAYSVTEDWAIEGFYATSFNSPNNNYKALQNTGSGIFPIIREITSQYGGLVRWSPWYSKINVFNTILHFDWYFTAGAGQINSNVSSSYTSPTNLGAQNLFSFFFGTGHLFHLNDTFDIRLDFTGALYNAPYTLAGDTSWFTNYNFGIGLGLKL